MGAYEPSNVKPQYLYAALLDEDTAVTEGIATTPSACAHSGGCLTGKEVVPVLKDMVRE